jgi:hypothetical protein
VNADDELCAAWSDFCQTLEASSELILRETAPSTPVDRAAGFQYLSRYIGKALDEKLEFDDPLVPELRHLQTPTSKSFGDNPDCTYLGATIDGGRTYRIVGNRGTVSWVSFAVGFSAINDADLVTEWDGSFEIVVGPEEHDGNWLRTSPGRAQLFIRQFFGHWDTEVPMRIRIEPIGPALAPPPPSPKRVADGLRAAAEWLVADSTRWADWIDFYRTRPNEFVAGMPGWAGDGAAESLNRSLQFCYWRIARDEVLLIEVRPPPARYWNFELGNYWMNSADYRYRLASLNAKQAVLEDDGRLVVVVAHDDPGVPNWLDTATHGEGLMVQRWVDADDTPTPEVRMVPAADLDEALGAARRVTVEERREQLRRRKVGVDRRFAV